MANPGERLINIVNRNKPKVLKGLSQKATESAQGLCNVLSGATGLPVDRARLTHSMLLQWNMETPYVSQKGKQPVRRAHRRAGMGGWKKRRPSCSGVDRG